MKKLLFVTPHLSTGGLPQYLYVKISNLIDLYDVYVLMWNDIAPIYKVQREKIENLLETNKNHFYYWDQGTPENIKTEEFKDIINSIKPDIIHIEEFPETFLPKKLISSLYKEDRTYTLIETSHSNNFNPNSKRVLPDSFAFVSPIQEQKFRHFRVPITIVEYPINKKERPDRNKALKLLGLDPSYKHVINVGLFTPGKNQAEIFEIARNLKNNKIQFHFIGNQADNFKHYWEPLMSNKPANCIIHGERNDVDSWYSACDLLLFTSKEELNPLVPREAIAWNMPVLMYNLDIYQNMFNEYEQVDYLTDSIDINIQKMLKTLGMNSLTRRKPLPKIRLTHLLTRSDDEREQASIKSLSPLKKLGIDYIQHINKPETKYPDIKPLSNHTEKKPGYWGAYSAFRRAIEEEFTGDLDFFMICECDCILTIKPEHFIEALKDVCDVVNKNDIYYFSFGATGENGVTWSVKTGNVSDFAFETNKIILAHCILFPQKARNFLLKRCKELSWDSPDLWMNIAFSGLKKMAILNEPLAVQHEGMSLIDNEVKEGGVRIQTFDIPDKDMISLLKEIYENTEIEIKEELEIPVTYNFNFVDGAFLEVKGDKIPEDENNTFYKNLKGFFDFEDVYKSMVEEFGNGSSFVEVGSWHGKSACYMATEIKNRELDISFDCIDNWQNMLSGVTNSADSSQEEFDDNMRRGGLEDYVTSIKSDSVEAASFYEDNSLDFVFIDADHRYEGCKKDIEAWYPKVKDGGILAGHDYVPIKNYGVIEAVNDVIGKDNITQHYTTWLHRKNNDKPIDIKSDKYVLVLSDGTRTIYSDKLPINHFVRSGIKYYIPWELRIYKGTKKVFEHKYNAQGKTIYISIESSPLGDNIAWMPYIEEFRKRHKCNVVCSCFWSQLFRKSYPYIKFVAPGTTIHNIYAMYKISYSTENDNARFPFSPVTSPMQKIAADILGIPFKEIRTKIDIPEDNSNIKGKYVCMSMHSTAQFKYWNYPYGWVKIVEYLKNRGYKVINISKEKSGYMGNKHPRGIVDRSGNKNISERLKELKGADLFIGVSSGLSWLALAIGIPTVIISGATKPWSEPQQGVYRVHNNEVCNGCFNNSNYVFDKGNWNWCPENKNFECTKSITPDMVIKEITKALDVKEQKSWDNDNMWKDDGNELSHSFENTKKPWEGLIYPKERMIKDDSNNKLVVISVMYNCENYIDRCINSIRNQNYNNYECYIIDDASTDNSVKKALWAIDGDSKFNVICNEKKKWMTGNFYENIHRKNINNNDIIVAIDGDDCLPDVDVFNRVNDAYTDGNIWFTYGSFIIEESGNIKEGWTKDVENIDLIYSEPWVFTHLKTFKAGLYRKIKKEDFIDPETNYYFKATGDINITIPMIQMAGINKIKHLPDVNYIYNCNNPINSHKVRSNEQIRIRKYIMTRKPYEQIKTLSE